MSSAPVAILSCVAIGVPLAKQTSSVTTATAAPTQRHTDSRTNRHRARAVDPATHADHDSGPEREHAEREKVEVYVAQHRSSPSIESLTCLRSPRQPEAPASLVPTSVVLRSLQRAARLGAS